MYKYKAKVTSVYDADTITCDIDLGFGVVMRKQKIRLFGIDAPEMRGESRPEGIKARDFVRDCILDSEITLQTVKDKKGKYGRWLGVVSVGTEGTGVNLNDLLVSRGFAVLRTY